MKYFLDTLNVASSSLSDAFKEEATNTHNIILSSSHWNSAVISELNQNPPKVIKIWYVQLNAEKDCSLVNYYSSQASSSQNFPQETIIVCLTSFLHCLKTKA